MFSENELKRVLENVSGGAVQAPMAWLRVSGPDAAVFLQGQCTQELRDLRPGQAIWALWLSLKGKVLGETLVLREGGGGDTEAWWLWSAHTPGEALRTRLEEFIIADDVTVEDAGAAGGWEQATLAGPAGERFLREALGGAEPPSEGAWVALAGGYVFAGRRKQPRIWDWLRPAGAGALAGLALLRPEELVRARIAAGVPAIPGEFGPGDLPQEAGLETVAVSFTKGCYLGQEIMARLHAMGQVRRRLVRAGGDGAAPAAGAVLHHAADGKRAGELRAAVDDGRGGWLGLAMVNLLGLDRSRPLELDADGPAGARRPVHLLDLSSP